MLPADNYVNPLSRKPQKNLREAATCGCRFHFNGGVRRCRRHAKMRHDRLVREAKTRAEREH